MAVYCLAKNSDPIILVCEQSSSRMLVALIEVRCPKMAHPRAKNSAREFAPVTRSYPVRFGPGFLVTGNFARFRKVRPQRLYGEGRSYFGL